MMREYIGIATCTVFVLWSVVLYAGQPDHPKKLPAPENVVCPVVGDHVDISWDVVDGAHSYRVEYLGFGEDVPAIRETLPPVFVPPVSLPLGPFGAVVLRVQALEAPKHAHNPLEAGKKGAWSELCTVLLEVNPL